MPEKRKPPAFTVCPARPEDYAEIATLTQALAVYLDSESAATAETLIRDAAHYSLLIAENAGDGIIGFLMHYPGYDLESATPGRHLGDLFVTESWRGRGVAKMLIAELSRLTLAEGGAWVSFTVVSKNKAALKFYDTLGAVRQKVEFLAMGRQALVKMG